MEQVKLVNPDWLRSNFPCRAACPVGTEAGRYVNLIAQGRYREAYRVAREPNPFASICGRICAAPCEDACRRGKIDAPLSIRALKRFVCERYGVESMIDVGRIREIIGPALPRREEKVAVVGAGPAGMSAAHDLALLGYRVAVFEAQSVPGGMLRLGIPEYRLPRELVRMEINVILSLGVDLRLNQRMGRDFSLRDLREGFDAVFLAVGAHKSRDLRIEGVGLDGVLRGVDFLLNVNMGYKVYLGERVVVIGGGNVALDVARTVARQEPPVSLTAARMVEALDVARMAVRFGAREVHVVCLESREEMPADPLEVEEAEKERITLHPRRGPARILGEGGKVAGLETLDVASVFDEAGRFNPKFTPGTERVLPADSIIMAIGQASDLSFLSPEDGLTVTPRGTLQVDRETLATTAPGVYVGGDVAFGPRIAIEAVADGKRAARSIDAYLRGGEGGRREVFEVIVHDTITYRQAEDFEKVSRQPVPSLPIDRRIGVAQVELGYDETTAVREARRCLRCWINTVFEGREEFGSECILCGGCADVCPESCIELVASGRVDRTGAGSDVPDLIGTILVKDEEKCIRCGLCARRCPVGCVAMEGFESAEVIAA